MPELCFALFVKPRRQPPEGGCSRGKLNAKCVKSQKAQSLYVIEDSKHWAYAPRHWLSPNM